MTNRIIPKAILALILAAAGIVAATAAKPRVVEPSYAWSLLPPLGLHEPATIDTLLYNYYQRSVPSEVSPAWCSTGNLGAEGINMIYMERPAMSDFFFHDALTTWLPPLGNHTYYNTRIPMTLLSYNTGGGRENEQNRLKATFSGNVNAKLQFGAHLDYLYSKGSYNNQATNDLVWGASASYIGDRWEMQTFYNHWNMLNKENGGITNPLYITDPAELQGGDDKIDAKSIPTNLSNAHTRLVGGEFYLNNRYKVGHWREEQVNDTTVKRTYIPVSSFIWTFDYRSDKHLFLDNNAKENAEFWENCYMSPDNTRDRTAFRSISNTLGVSLIEGFSKYMPFGLAAYARHEIRSYTQLADTLSIKTDERPNDLTPYPLNFQLPHNEKQNLLWVGAQLTKQRGDLLKTDVTAEFGLLGPAIGEVKIDGTVSTRFRLLRDTVNVAGYCSFHNLTAPYLMNNYVSNHFIWHNDFGKTRTLKAGGRLSLERTRTHIDVGIANVQNQIYFGDDGLPRQNSGSVQVFSASLNQRLHVGILNWDNKITYQTSSDQAVLPLPNLAVYSNLYLLFKVAKVLTVQFGADCDYYTRYYAPVYQPATMAFCNQQKEKVGNYPFMNLYLNMKLSKARFYVMFSHINQGWMGKEYFAMPGYPMNPRRFQMGVSVDLAN